jgi:hypothetical protein
MRDKPAGEPPPAPKIVFTTGRTPSPALAAALTRYGF